MLGVIFLVAAGISLIFHYLQTGFNVSKEIVTEYSRHMREVYPNWVGDALATVEGVPESKLEEGVADSSKSAAADAAAAGGIKAAEGRQRAAAQEQKNILHLSRERLAEAVTKLGYRGNINLALGGGTSLVGILILGFVVYSGVGTKYDDVWDFVTAYVPRLTLVLMIELFAFFFLSLYKSGLQEIKYFQNEITNIEAKHAALLLVRSLDNDETAGAMALLLAGTERNHVISKDQTTIELEKARIDKTSNAEMLGFLKDLIPRRGTPPSD